MSSAAARVGDPISHTSAFDGLLAGLAIGAGVALAGIAIVGTGGLAAVAVVGAAASGGAGLGQVFGSMHTSEAGAITSGSPNVRINGIAAARAHVDFVDCSKHSHKEVIATGSGGVRINGQPAARVDDKTACDGVISSGSSNVRLGGGTVQTDEINPEVPAWLEWTVAGVGVACAFVLASPAVVVGGLIGGLAGGIGGHWLGGELFGEGSNGQKLMMLGGSLIGGFAGGKGAQSLSSRYSAISNSTRSAVAKTPNKPMHSLSDAVGKETADSWISSVKSKAKKNNVDISKLSDDEAGAIFGYTTNEGYQALNPALRGQAKLTPELESFSSHLSNGLNKLDAVPGSYTRGSSPPAHVLDDYKIGNVVSDAAFKSTSKGDGFPGILQEKITSYSGRDISKLSAFESESEVLHLPNTKFMVENRIEHAGKILVKLTEVP